MVAENRIRRVAWRGPGGKSSDHSEHAGYTIKGEGLCELRTFLFPLFPSKTEKENFVLRSARNRVKRNPGFTKVFTNTRIQLRRFHTLCYRSVELGFHPP